MCGGFVDPGSPGGRTAIRAQSMLFKRLGDLTARHAVLIVVAWVVLLAVSVRVAPPWESVVANGELFGGGDFLLDDGVKSRDDSDDAESESLAVNFAAFFDEVLSEELHEEREFAGWSFPVFAGEAVEGELLESEPGGFFDDGAN